MKPNELRTVVYDAQLRLEAYRFAGIVQPFPNHFHEHYVLGLVEEGQRTLHELVLRGDAGFQKEEFLLCLFSALLERCGLPSAHSAPTLPTRAILPKHSAASSA